MRIALLIHAMGPGGAERVMAHLANGLLGRGHEVSLLTLSTRDGTSFYPLSPQIRQVPLGLGRVPRRKGALSVLAQVLCLLRGLRHHLQNQPPDVVLAFIDTTNIFALLSTIGLQLPIVISERSDPALAPLQSVWKIARWLSYPLAAALVVQSVTVRNWFPAWIRRKTLIIPNPVLPPPEGLPARDHNGVSRRIIAVGRLSREKGFDLLLNAFAKLAPRFPAWNVEIYGEGPLRAELELLRDQLGLQDRVAFPGLTQDIHSRYAQADIFVLSSRFEGFPNALCEAMAHGLPVVATACSGGVREIVRSGEDGFTVEPEDPESLSMALSNLIENEGLRTVSGTRAKDIVSRFSLDSVLDRWESCLEKVTLRRASR